ncbi:MAG: helix-turn-helix transcriptional regulator [Defluviitaleaceae bacterium]|nr:helix-turn-helix transcriptional regulator [Defluviitaleaceae bacterium]
MKKDKPLSMGEKIKLVRKAKGVNQAYLARVTGRSDMLISRIERGEAECTDEILSTIKAALDIPNAPLYEHELEVYKNRLLVWNDMVSEYRIKEARELQKELFPITVLPFERSLIALYLMIEARLHGRERNMPVLERITNEAEVYLDDACILGLHLYHRNKGMTYIHSVHPDYKKALKHFLKALDLQSTEVKLDVMFLSTIGQVYLYLGIPLQAMMFYERAKMMYGDDRLHPGVHNMNIGIALCYMHIGELTKAKGIYETALVHARSTNDDESVMLGIANMCAVYMRMKDYKKALMFSDQALKYGQKNLPYYMLALFNNASCLVELKMFPEAVKKIQEGQLLVDGQKPLSILFETLGHILTIKSNSSNDEKKAASDYVENVAIPYYMNHEDSQVRFAGIDICKTLEAYYKKKGMNKKAQAIVTILRNTYEKMFFVDSEAEFASE